MKLQTIKTQNDVNLAGVRTEFLYEDTSLRGVRITDKFGRTVIIKSGDTYSQTVKVLESNPYTEADRHRVEAVIGGKLLTWDFEQSYDADTKAREIGQELSNDNAAKVSKVRVLVDENGKTVCDAGETPADATRVAEEAITF